MDHSGPRSRRRWPVPVAIGAIVLVAVAVVGTVVLRADGDASGVVLEPAAAVPDDPFLDVTATPRGDDDDPASPPAAPEPGELDAPVLLAGGAVVGTDPGVYAGTRDVPACDLERLVELLTGDGDADLADEWFAALDRHADREDYLDDLTAVRLRWDTRVTAHDRDGPYPAVLQSGTAVLIDRFGIPRVRCAGGAPLDEPEPAPSDSDAGVDAVADPDGAWDGFDPARVVVVTGGTEAEGFDLADPASAELFRRPAGTDGERDRNARTEPEPPEECTDCRGMRIAIETVSGTPARIVHAGGTRPGTETDTELVWYAGTADPGTYSYTITHTYVGYMALDPDVGMDDPALYDDPRYDDEELVIDAPAGVVNECVPGDVTVTVTVDDVEAQTATETVTCAGEGSTLTYELAGR